MKFYNYISENDKEKYEQLSSKILEYIRNNCKKYIKEYIRNDKLLWSGREKEEKFYNVKKIRKDRQPKDTPEYIHNLLDEYFQNHHGIKLRSNSLFCYTSINDVYVYGTPHLICPIGEYETYYHPSVRDLFKQFKTLLLPEEIYHEYDKGIPPRSIFSKRPDLMEELNSNINSLTRGYKRGVPKRNYPEIMLYGDKYIIIGYNILQFNDGYLLSEIKEM